MHFLGPSLERVLCSLKFEIQMRGYELCGLGGHLQLLFLYFLQQHGSVYWKKGSIQILKNASSELPLHQSLKVTCMKELWRESYAVLFLILTHCFSPCKPFLLFEWAVCSCSMKWNVLVIPSAPGLLTFCFLLSDNIYCFKSLQVPVGIPESFCVRVTACLFFYEM